MLPYLAAVAAAAMFALATALQHRAARAGPSIAGGPKAVGRALGGLLSRRLWLAGLAADAAGFAFHAYALTTGSLAVVQPLLVSSLLFALPLGAWLDRRPVKTTELKWAAVTVLSLAAFLMLARPSGGGDSPELGPSASAAAVTLLLVLGCLLAGRGAPSRRAATLGAITGLAYGATAALIKAVGSSFGHDADSLLTSWPLYVLLVIGPVGFVLNQIAFQAGPLSASLPAITAVDPLASVALGVLLYDERLHGTAWAAAGAAIALLLLTWSVIHLARAEQQQRQANPDPDDHPRAGTGNQFHAANNP